MQVNIKSALEQMVAVIPPEAVADALVSASIILSSISQGDLEVPPPADPIVALISLLETAGVRCMVARNEEEANRMIEEAKARGIPAKAADIHVGPAGQKLN